MSEHSETLADVLAEMRKRMKSYYYSREGRNLMRQYADRIEAAWKRQEQCYLDQIRDAVNQWGHERYKAEHAPVGNSAAMRETLELCIYALDCEIRGEQANDAEDLVGCIMVQIGRMRDALAEPPRNCDLYDSYGDAIRAFEDAENAEDYEEMAEWDYAPATEQKGEEDGGK